MAPRDSLSSFFPLPICSAQPCQAMGLGKGEQVKGRNNQGLVWCEESLRVPPSP